MPVIDISGLDTPGVEVFASMTEAQLRASVDAQNGIFIAESPKVIAVALSAGYKPLSLLCEKKHILGDAAE
ncbi:MAG: RNA methyltransferase, partial [Paramuribaculum sp.]|nr:RNA methyltransferase [Paramuribaculum sp.]